MMDLGVSLEIQRYRLVGDIHDLHARTPNRLGIKRESTQITREDRSSPTGQKPTHIDEEFSMVTLHVPASLAHLRRIREGGRINEDKIPAHLGVAHLSDPLDAISADELLVPVHETVEFHVVLTPPQVRIRKVNARRELRPVGSCIDARRAGVCEKIEKALALRKFADKLACVTMVEEQSRVEIAREVNIEEQTVFLGDEPARIM